MRKILFLLALLSLSACSGQKTARHCAEQPPQIQGNFEPIPASFSARFPAGSQKRKLQDLQATFDTWRPRFKAITDEALAKDPCAYGKVILAIALAPNGAVAGKDVVFRNTTAPLTMDRIVEEVAKLNFGPSTGDGYYVFKYPIDFARPKSPG